MPARGSFSTGLPRRHPTARPPRQAASRRARGPHGGPGRGGGQSGHSALIRSRSVGSASAKGPGRRASSSNRSSARTEQPGRRAGVRRRRRGGPRRRPPRASGPPPPTRRGRPAAPGAARGRPESSGWTQVTPDHPRASIAANAASWARRRAYVTLEDLPRDPGERRRRVPTGRGGWPPARSVAHSSGTADPSAPARAPAMVAMRSAVAAVVDRAEHRVPEVAAGDQQQAEGQRQFLDGVQAGGAAGAERGRAGSRRARWSYRRHRRAQRVERRSQSSGVRPRRTRPRSRLGCRPWPGTARPATTD